MRAFEFKAGSEKALSPSEFSTTFFCKRAIEFIKATQEKRTNNGPKAPFFLTVAFTAPHDPRTPPPSWRYRGDVNLPANWLPEPRFDNGELEVRV